MHIPELTQFLGVGEGRIWWRLTIKNAVGFVIGLLISQQIGELLGLQGPLSFALTIAGIILGVWLTTQQNALIRFIRLLLLLRFLFYRVRGGRTIDSAHYYTTTGDIVQSPKMRIRARDGHTVFTTRRDLPASYAPPVSETSHETS